MSWRALISSLLVIGAVARAAVVCPTLDKLASGSVPERAEGLVDAYAAFLSLARSENLLSDADWEPLAQRPFTLPSQIKGASELRQLLDQMNAIFEGLPTAQREDVRKKIGELIRGNESVASAHSGARDRAARTGVMTLPYFYSDEDQRSPLDVDFVFPDGKKWIFRAGERRVVGDVDADPHSWTISEPDPLLLGKAKYHLLSRENLLVEAHDFNASANARWLNAETLEELSRGANVPIPANYFLGWGLLSAHFSPDGKWMATFVESDRRNRPSVPGVYKLGPTPKFWRIPLPFLRRGYDGGDAFHLAGFSSPSRLWSVRYEADAWNILNFGFLRATDVSNGKTREVRVHFTGVKSSRLSGDETRLFVVARKPGFENGNELWTVDTTTMETVGSAPLETDPARKWDETSYVFLGDRWLLQTSKLRKLGRNQIAEPLGETEVAIFDTTTGNKVAAGRWPRQLEKVVTSPSGQHVFFVFEASRGGPKAIEAYDLSDWLSSGRIGTRQRGSGP